LEFLCYSPTVIALLGEAKELYKSLVHPLMYSIIHNSPILKTTDECFAEVSKIYHLPTFHLKYGHLLAPTASSIPKIAAAAVAASNPAPADRYAKTECINCKKLGHPIHQCREPCPCGQCLKPSKCPVHAPKIAEMNANKKAKLARLSMLAGNSKIPIPRIPAVIDSAATGVFLQSSSPISN